MRWLPSIGRHRLAGALLQWMLRWQQGLPEGSAATGSAPASHTAWPPLTLPLLRRGLRGMPPLCWYSPPLPIGGVRFEDDGWRPCMARHGERARPKCSPACVPRAAKARAPPGDEYACAVSCNLFSLGSASCASQTPGWPTGQAHHEHAAPVSSMRHLARHVPSRVAGVQHCIVWLHCCVQCGSHSTEIGSQGEAALRVCAVGQICRPQPLQWQTGPSTRPTPNSKAVASQRVKALLRCSRAHGGSFASQAGRWPGRGEGLRHRGGRVCRGERI